MDRTQIDDPRIRLGPRKIRILMLSDPLLVVALLAGVFDDLGIGFACSRHGGKQKITIEWFPAQISGEGRRL